MNFCDYKDSLGIPKQGVHAERMNVFGLSLAKNDIIATIFIGIILAIIAGIILTFAMNLNMNMRNTIIFWMSLLIFWIIVAFVLGILLHWLFCVKTELNNFLGM
jgi:hypothetical protein